MKPMADQIKNSKFVVIENAGHMAPIEKAEVVTSSIQEFLQEKI